jgi:hypothetical protein
MILVRITFVRRVAVGIAWAMAAAGCVGGYTVVQTLPTVTLEGKLEGGRIDGFDCVWLVDAQGRRVDVMYPAGFDTASNPVRLIDRSGTVVAARGDLVFVSGPDGIGESVCAPDVFNAETVEVLPSASARRKSPGAVPAAHDGAEVGQAPPTTPARR